MSTAATREPGSLWQRELPPRPDRPALHGEVTADVVIIGAGFTGLWTAYYLSVLAPDRRVLVIEAESVGYGASGRNGGWCTAEMPALLASLVRRYGPMDAMRFFRTARKTLDEIERVLDAESVDAGFTRDGSLYVARTRPQEDRLRAWQDMRLKLGIRDLTLLGPAEADAYVRVDGVRLAGFTPHCAAVQPAALAAGLAVAVERRGVTIAEHTRAVRVTPGTVVTPDAVIRAPAVLTATEAYTGGLTGHARRVLPVISRAIATAPLPARRGRRSAGAAGSPSPTPLPVRLLPPHGRGPAGRRRAGRQHRAGSGTSAAGRYGDRTFARLRAAAAEMFRRWPGTRSPTAGPARTACTGTASRPSSTTRRPGSATPAATAARASR
ncbi:FAD-binding oxidoreductase [Micromonospora sp. R77]|uniref:NAD(P)/FAD-dependent oxidoreductase n=1 Tax=Micromonospora sp. R77 TaxID=2925836 RepID=UPI001F6168D8|nr:FAD-dependent oxidoreductase [Micromonospora sp. R77]MCI4066455.1 FAD-binding oxidoreductase [Micromonospora sp. R77]